MKNPRQTAAKIHFVFLAATACLILTSGCSTHATSSPSQSTVYAQPGQTVKQLVDSLPANGGTVALGVGTWSSGYSSTAVITKPNVTILGAGMPSFNSTFTAMTGATIIQGILAATLGADYLSIRNLGVDTGQEYIDAENSGVPTDAVAIFNNGQVVGAAQVESPDIENVSCLGYSTTSPFHCMLVENVNHAYVHNVVTVNDLHGLVLKGTNSIVDGVYGRGHSNDSIIVKSDNYAPASQDSLSNIRIEPLLSAGDTKGIIILGLGAPVSDISISHVSISSPSSWGINVQGTSPTTSAVGLKFSDITVAYRGGSPAGEYCMEFTQYVSDISINNLNCSGMWAGIVPYLPDATTFRHFTVTDSQLTNIATTGIEAYGNWSISNTVFGSIDGDAIVSVFGTTTVIADTFTNIGGNDTYEDGGTIVVSSP